MAAKQGFLKYYSEWRCSRAQGECLAAIDRVAAHQGWPLRGVPLYSVV